MVSLDLQQGQDAILQIVIFVPARAILLDFRIEKLAAVVVSKHFTNDEMSTTLIPVDCGANS